MAANVPVRQLEGTAAVGAGDGDGGRRSRFPAIVGRRRRRARHDAILSTLLAVRWQFCILVVMTAYATGGDTIVVRVGVDAKLQLAERARENDRSLSAETRRALREYLAARPTPTTRRRSNDEGAAVSGAIGRELKRDASRAGVVDDGNRVARARRSGIAAMAAGAVEDFEPAGRRRWLHKASGTLYRKADGCPLLAVGTDATRDVSVFFVDAGKLTFLELDDIPEAMTVHHGVVTGRRGLESGGHRREIH